MPEHEEYKEGTVFCKIEKKYIDRMQAINNQKMAIQQFLNGLLRDQAAIIAAEGALWEEIKKEYLLTDHTAYFVDFRTGELKIEGRYK